MENKTNYRLPKVILFAATSKEKSYCWERWIDNVMLFKYPNFEIFIADNSTDNGEYCKYMNDYFHSKYGQNNFKFQAIRSNVKHLKDSDFLGRVAISLNNCATYISNNDALFAFSLETDVFPQLDIIEQLMVHKKRVIGAMFDIDYGKRRRLCAQRRYFIDEKEYRYATFLKNEEIAAIDGTVKKFADFGLGCVLMDANILKRIKFRSDKVTNAAPDTFFHADLYQANIRTWLHTGIVCRHENTDYFWDSVKK